MRQFLLVAASIFGFGAMAQSGPILVRYVGETKDRHFQERILNAIERIMKFSKSQKLGIENSGDFVKEAIVYDSKESFDKMVATSPGWPHEKRVPAAYLGVSKNKTFYVVDWPTYKNVHPSYTMEDYENLITHELAHLFHVAYLRGDEDRMGPIWFYEGFACLVAGQYLKSPLPQKVRLHEILFTDKRNSYRDYASIMLALSRVRPIGDLLKHAPDGDFSKQSESALNPPSKRGAT